MDGSAPVEVRVTVDRRAYYINTGVSVRAREWKFGQVVNRQDSEELNERVGIILSKGSRDGIVVPKERPARYVEEAQEEELPVPSFFSDFTPAQDLPPVSGSEEEIEKRSSRRRRGRRGGKGKGEEVPAQQSAPKAESAKQEKSEPIRTG